jgi:hypothetical protein
MELKAFVRTVQEKRPKVIESRIHYMELKGTQDGGLLDP